MVKFRLYKNFFGNISFITVDNFSCYSKALKQLIDIFKPQYLIISITALDSDSDFFKIISDRQKQFKIILPTNNTITSKTIIMSNASDFLSVFDLLIKSEPRCITLYGLEDNIKLNHLNYKEFQYADDTIVSKEITDYVISIILEEDLIKITFNNNLYTQSILFKAIKKSLKEL